MHAGQPQMQFHGPAPAAIAAQLDPRRANAVAAGNPLQAIDRAALFFELPAAVKDLRPAAGKAADVELPRLRVGCVEPFQSLLGFALSLRRAAAQKIVLRFLDRVGIPVPDDEHVLPGARRPAAQGVFDESDCPIGARVGL